ncbi:hypothetical protein Tco_1267316 [Tanacetum coccineum]
MLVLKSVKKSPKKKVWKPTGKVFTNIGYIWRPTGQTFTELGNVCPLTRITTTTEVPLRIPSALDNETPKPVITLVYSRKPMKSKTNGLVSKSKVVQIVLWYLDFDCSKHMTEDRSQLSNFGNKVKFGNDHVAKILDMVIIKLGMLGYQGFTTWKDLDTTYSPLGNFVIRTLKLLSVNTPASFVIWKVFIY